MNENDSILIERCIGGSDPQAWEDFVKKYADLIWNAIRRTFVQYNFIYHKEDSEDLFDAIFLSLIENDFKKLRQFKGENNCSLSTWLAVVAGRRTIDYMRRDKGHLSAEPVFDQGEVWDTIADCIPPADEVLAQKQTRELIAREVGLLKPRDRLIYHLIFVKGCDAEETAKLLGMSAGLVYSKKHRIIRKLKKSVSGV